MRAAGPPFMPDGLGIVAADLGLALIQRHDVGIARLQLAGLKERPIEPLPFEGGWCERQPAVGVSVVANCFLDAFEKGLFLELSAAKQDNSRGSRFTERGFPVPGT